MPYEGIVQHTYQNLPPEKQAAAYQFMLFLASCPDSVSVVPEKKQKGKRKLGVLADRFHGIADDFNDPLPEFGEYL